MNDDGKPIVLRSERRKQPLSVAERSFAFDPQDEANSKGERSGWAKNRDRVGVDFWGPVFDAIIAGLLVRGLEQPCEGCWAVERKLTDGYTFDEMFDVRDDAWAAWCDAHLADHEVVKAACQARRIYLDSRRADRRPRDPACRRCGYLEGIAVGRWSVARRRQVDDSQAMQGAVGGGQTGTDHPLASLAEIVLAESRASTAGDAMRWLRDRHVVDDADLEKRLGHAGAVYIERVQHDGRHWLCAGTFRGVEMRPRGLHKALSKKLKG